MPRQTHQTHLARHPRIVTTAAGLSAMGALLLATAGSAQAAPSATPAPVPATVAAVPAAVPDAAAATATARPQVSTVPAPVPDVSTSAPQIGVPAGNAFSTSSSPSASATGTIAGFAIAGGLLLVGGAAGAVITIRRRA